MSRTETVRDDAQSRADEASRTVSDEADDVDSDAAGDTPRSNNQSSDARLQACENRATAVDRIVDRHSQRIGRFLDLFNHFSDEVTSLYDQYELEIDEYEARLQEISDQDEAVRLGMTGLEQYTDGIDCSNPEPAAGIRDYIGEYRDLIGELDRYRSLVVALGRDVRVEWSSAELDSSDNETEQDMENGGNDED